jgi:hypothetical protein
MTDLVTGDTGSRLKWTLKDRATGNPIDLTGATVRIRWRGNDGVVVTKTATLFDAENGVISYQFQTGDIIAPKMAIEVEITDAAGKVNTSLDLTELTVREELG